MSIPRWSARWEPTPPAAVAINASPTWLISSILSAIGVGYSVQVAHSIGAKDKQATARIVRQALLAVLFMGISIMLICLLIAPHLPKWMGAQPDVLPDAVRYLQIYVLSLPFQCGSYTFSAVLRCMGDTKTPLILNTAANLLNVVLNFFLIFPTRPTELFGMSFTVPGAGWGVAGAAIATTISTAITGLGISYTALFRKPDCRISLHDSFKPDREIIHRALELGVPTALEHATVSAGQIGRHPHQRYAGHRCAGCRPRRSHRRGLELYAGRRHLLRCHSAGWTVLRRTGI